jgi:hypothetical protein
MSQVGDNESVLSDDTGSEGASEGLKLVPVAESIRYRKRAQKAEKEVEALAEQLTEAKRELSDTSAELVSVQVEQKLMSKLAAAGAVDLEAAVMLAKSKVAKGTEADVDGAVEQLKKDKQYLFSSSGRGLTEHGGRVDSTVRKTSGARERIQSGQITLEKAAKKAATTGNRIDLQEYLRLRRNLQ